MSVGDPVLHRGQPLLQASSPDYPACPLPSPEAKSAADLPIYDDRSSYCEPPSPARRDVHPRTLPPDAAHIPAQREKLRGVDLPHPPALAYAAADTPECRAHSADKAGHTGNHLPRDHRQWKRRYFLDLATAIPQQSFSGATVSEISQLVQRPKTKNVTSICDFMHNGTIWVFFICEMASISLSGLNLRWWRGVEK